MAQIVLGLGTGHASTLGSPPSQVRRVAERDKVDSRIDYAAQLARVRPGMDVEVSDERMQEHYEACVSGVTRLKRVLDEVDPDVMIIVGDDQHEQFLDDNLPMFCALPWRRPAGAAALAGVGEPRRGLAGQRYARRLSCRAGAR